MSPLFASLAKRRWLVIFAVALIAVALWRLAPSTATPAAADGAAAKSAKAALSVSLTQAKAAQWPQTISVNGSIAAWQEAIVGAEASGLRLDEVLVNVGDRVRQGQLLARLQSETVAAELAQTRASRLEAEASLAEAVANAERARSLQDTGAMSAQQIDQLLTSEQVARARVAVLQAKQKADEVRLRQTEIRAPDDGSISARLATLGAVVQPGQELFRLIRRDRLEWRAEVPAADLKRLAPGMPATVYTASGAAAAGTLRMVAPTVDAQTRSGLVYVDLKQAGDAKAGMFARGDIELGATRALALPQAAVQLRDGFHYIYRYNDNGTVTQAKIAVGRRQGNDIEILSGIDAATRVVAGGVGFLADGDTVRVVTDGAKPAAAPVAKGQ